MKYSITEKFDKSIKNFPAGLKKKFAKQLKYLLADIRHPSLHAKKYDEAENIWQARADRDVRFYFKIKGDVYILLDILKHPK